MIIFVHIINMIGMLTIVVTSVCRESTGEYTRHAVGSGCFGKCSTIFVSAVNPQIAGRVGYQSIREKVDVTEVI